MQFVHIHHKIIEYTAQEIEYASEDFPIYIIVYKIKLSID